MYEIKSGKDVNHIPMLLEYVIPGFPNPHTYKEISPGYD